MVGLKRLALSYSETIFTPRKKLLSFSLLLAFYLLIFPLLLPNKSFCVSQCKFLLSSSSGNISLLIDPIQNITNASLHVGEQTSHKENKESNLTVVIFSDSSVHQRNSSEIVKGECFSDEKHRTKTGNSSVVYETQNVGNFSEGKQKSNASLIHDKKIGLLYKECVIFNGKWVRDESRPLYPFGSCPYIDKSFDCNHNGRPDRDFTKWRWQPNDCDIPRLNGTDFLERLRGKRLVYVGDSLNRNMWESMVCILRQSLRYKKRVYEISGRTDFKKKGVYSFRFEDYNCSVDFIVSPFLVRESSSIGKNGTFETLRLDLMDKTASTCYDADIIVFNTAHWWTHEKTSRGEWYYQERNYVHPKMDVLRAYRKALSTWARWVDRSIDANRTQIFFRSYSHSHFSGGQWNSGGKCHKESEPILNETYLQKYQITEKMGILQYTE